MLHPGMECHSALGFSRVLSLSRPLQTLSHLFLCLGSISDSSSSLYGLGEKVVDEWLSLADWCNGSNRAFDRKDRGTFRW